MVKAIWNGKVIAEADRTEIVEGNHYFPSKSLRGEFFQPSDTHTICPWKGKAHYYTLLVDGKENADAAWYYPDPKPAAQKIAPVLQRNATSVVLEREFLPLLAQTATDCVRSGLVSFLFVTKASP